MIKVVFVSSLKEFVDLLADAIPDPDSGEMLVKKYNVHLSDDFRGQYIAIVTPEGVQSNPTSRSSNYSNYMVGIYCMYFKDTDDDFVEAREKYLAWVDKVFDAFHLKNFGGAQYVTCDFKLSSGEFGKMTESVIRGVVSLNIRKTAFVNN